MKGGWEANNSTVWNLKNFSMEKPFERLELKPRHMYIYTHTQTHMYTNTWMYALFLRILNFLKMKERYTDNEERKEETLKGKTIKEKGRNA